jgi:hypothetical protein
MIMFTRFGTRRVQAMGLTEYSPHRDLPRVGAQRRTHQGVRHARADDGAHGADAERGEHGAALLDDAA